MNGSAGAASDVAFVVIGRNEGERLRACLRSITPYCKAIIYVDSQSEDESVEIAEAQGAQVVKLEDGNILTAALGRSAGLKALRDTFPQCRYVHFIDGDCILQPGWLDAALNHISSDDRIAVVCGTRFEAKPKASIYNAILNEEWNTPPGVADSCGGDSLIRVAALDEVGSFRTELKSCEEPELCSRLRAAGWRIWRLPVPMTEHDAAMTSLSQWWKRGARAGFGYAQVWRMAPSGRTRLYGRELASTFAWAVAVPLLAIAASLFMRSLIPLGIAVALYSVQIVRIAAKREFRDRGSWQRAVLILVGKFAAAWGAISCLAGSSRQQTSYR